LIIEDGKPVKWTNRIIEKWLIERGMEHDNERWLLENFVRSYIVKEYRPAISSWKGSSYSINERRYLCSYKRLTFMRGRMMYFKIDQNFEFDEEKKQTFALLAMPKRPIQTLSPFYQSNA
jgi:hypothetical protein